MDLNKLGVNQLLQLFKQMFPSGSREWILFFLVFAFYISYSLVLALGTNLIDYPAGWDLFFSFDSPFYYNDGTLGPNKHPLISKFTMPLMHIGEVLKQIGGVKGKTVGSIVFCTTLISCSIVYIFRYLKTVIGLKSLISYILAAFFGVFSANMILCFTPESFTFSAFFIAFTTYFFSYNIRAGENTKLLPSCVLAIFLGGTTITNLSKIGIPVLFTNHSIKTKVKYIACIGSIFLIIMGWLEYKHGIIEGILFNYVAFSSDQIVEGSFFYKAVDFFFGSPILFPDMFWDTNKTIPEYNINGTINITFYRHWWQYATVGFLYLLVILSVIKGYRNRLVWMLVSLFGVDIFLHVILKFGIGEGFIYGAHWICVIPLLMGWLYKSTNDRYKPYLVSAICVLMLTIFINNTYQISNFIKLAFEKYPYLG